MLGMPTNFSRAGLLIAALALSMAFANFYSSALQNHARGPKSVRTNIDHGEYWRFLVVISDMCLLGLCTFLVLGGTLLDGYDPGSYSQKT